MKCKVVSYEKEKKDIKYPCLMISSHLGTAGEIVLFVDDSKGFNVNGFNHVLGHYSENWIMGYFKYDPNLTIELTNKE